MASKTSTNNLIFMKENQIVKTPKDELYDQDALPLLPYEKLDAFYSMSKYLGPTYLGSKTIAYHSSVGCPFTCSFCGLVPIYNARGTLYPKRSKKLLMSDVEYLLVPIQTIKSMDAIAAYINSLVGYRLKDEPIPGKALVVIEKYLRIIYRQRRASQRRKQDQREKTMKP